MTVSEIASLSNINFFDFFNQPAVEVNCNGSCGKSSNTMQAVIRVII